MFKLLLMVVILVSCGKKNQSESGKPEVHTDPIHERPLDVTQRELVSFVRHEQMVSRYNCDGRLVTRKFETRNSLSKKITINYENRKKAYSYSVYNRRTKSSAKGAFTKEGKFVVDYAPTVFNMRVKQGINDVEYIFNRCVGFGNNPQGEVVCLKSELEKEGMIQIDVTYSSVVDPGELHVHPQPEACKAD